MLIQSALFGFILSAIHPGAAPPVDHSDLVSSEIEELRSAIDAHRRNRPGETSITDLERRQDIQALVIDVLDDASGRTSFAGDDADRAWNQISSASGDFTLNLGVFTQFDWVLNARPGESREYGTELQNVFLDFQGTVIDPSWSYWIRMTYSPDGPQNSGEQYAFIQKDLDDGWSIQAGLLTPYFSFEQAIDTTDQVGISVSFIAGQFDPESSEGLSVNWQGDELRSWVAVCNGFSPPGASPLQNQRTAAIARGEWKLFGNWDDLYLPNAFPGMVESGLLFGVGASYGNGTARTEGNPPESGVDIRLTSDVVWQRPGASLLASVSWQDASEEIPSGGLRLASMIQGAFWPDAEKGEKAHWMLYARGEWGSVPDEEVSELAVATLGSSWFSSEHRNIRWSIELLRVWGDTTRWKIDGNPGFLSGDGPQSIIRSQVQIAF